ncbi:hypothetical protein GK48_25325 [Salmonella enterica subsp. diarizonae]|nr:hypothetical protein [Salmonella enterica subsp. diarizonae]
MFWRDARIFRASIMELLLQADGYHQQHTLLPTEFHIKALYREHTGFVAWRELPPRACAWFSAWHKEKSR